jgi:hypothetical protein
MKKLTVYILSILGIVVSATGCKENQMDDYTNEPAVYFDHSKNQSDSINYSFFIFAKSVIRDTVYVKIRTMGIPADYDRPVKVIQTNSGKSDAAVAGVHFVAFDNAEVRDSFRIPAKAVDVDIPVIVLRDPSLLTEEKRLELSVAENDYFREGIDKWRTFVVKISDLATKPLLWDTYWKYYLGESWGVVKMQFAIQATGYIAWESQVSDFGYVTWLSATAKQALLEYNLAHPDDPLREVNGDIVTFDK